MHRHGRNAHLPQTVDLVFHQGYERRDHYAESVARQRGHLVGERLAAARGHERQSVAAVQHGADYGLLPRAKLRVAPVFAEHLSQIRMLMPVQIAHNAAKLTKKRLIGRIFTIFASNKVRTRMRIKQEYKVREIAGEHTVIIQGRQGADLTKIITLNDSALLLWNSLAGRDFETDDAARILADNYSVEAQTALRDARAWVRRMQEYGLTD